MYTVLYYYIFVYAAVFASRGRAVAV